MTFELNRTATQQKREGNRASLIWVISFITSVVVSVNQDQVLIPTWGLTSANALSADSSIESTGYRKEKV